jgi:hypothetical protein
MHADVLGFSEPFVLVDSGQPLRGFRNDPGWLLREERANSARDGGGLLRL